MIHRKDYDDYADWVARVQQEMEERQERALIAECRALPASDEEIDIFRTAVRDLGERQGMTVKEAHTWADAQLREYLVLKILGPHFDVIDEA
jgi:hypothetical protein